MQAKEKSAPVIPGRTVEYPCKAPCLCAPSWPFARQNHPAVAVRDTEAPWLTLPDAIADLGGLIVEAHPDDLPFLQKHRAHLIQRMDHASEALNRDSTCGSARPMTTGG